MSFLVRGACKLVRGTYDLGAAALSRTVQFAKDHPYISAVAGAALAYYAYPTVASCFSSTESVCIPQPPLCTTDPQQSLLGSDFLGYLWYGNPGKSCLPRPDICSNAVHATCTQIINALGTTNTEAGIALAVGTAGAAYIINQNKEKTEADWADLGRDAIPLLQDVNLEDDSDEESDCCLTRILAQIQ